MISSKGMSVSVIEIANFEDPRFDDYRDIRDRAQDATYGLWMLQHLSDRRSAPVPQQDQEVGDAHIPVEVEVGEAA